MLCSKSGVKIYPTLGLQGLTQSHVNPIQVNNVNNDHMWEQSLRRLHRVLLRDVLVDVPRHVGDWLCNARCVWVWSGASDAQNRRTQLEFGLLGVLSGFGFDAAIADVRERYWRGMIAVSLNRNLRYCWGERHMGIASHIGYLLRDVSVIRWIQRLPRIHIVRIWILEIL